MQWNKEVFHFKVIMDVFRKDFLKMLMAQRKWQVIDLQMEFFRREYRIPYSTINKWVDPSFNSDVYGKHLKTLCLIFKKKPDDFYKWVDDNT